MAELLTAAKLGIRPFFGFLCDRCGVVLEDRLGRPRWEILWPFVVVCAGGCRLSRSERERRAALS